MLICWTKSSQDKQSNLNAKSQSVMENITIPLHANKNGSEIAWIE